MAKIKGKTVTYKDDNGKVRTDRVKDLKRKGGSPDETKVIRRFGLADSVKTFLRSEGGNR